MIAIIDYGVGNLFSLKSSLKYLGIDAEATSRAEDLISADKIILPGVGAFADAISKLRDTGLVDTLSGEVRKGKPILGICLGMQLMFDASYEYGEHEGLGLIPGIICSIETDLRRRGIGVGARKLKVPHIGWNRLCVYQEDPIFKYFNDGDFVYYVHSYYAKGFGAHTIGMSEYGLSIPGVVRNEDENIYGMQFHPEKSGAAGLSLLKAFNEIV